MYKGTILDLPHPVSPWMHVMRLFRIEVIIFSRCDEMGRLSRDFLHTASTGDFGTTGAGRGDSPPPFAPAVS